MYFTLKKTKMYPEKIWSVKHDSVLLDANSDLNFS